MNIIIAGYNENISCALSKCFLEKGADVAIVSYRTELISKLENEGNTAASDSKLRVYCTVETSPEDIAILVKKAADDFNGRIDALVNTGICADHSSVADLQEDLLDKMFMSGVWLDVRTAQECIPYFEQVGYGSIVNIVSSAGVTGDTSCAGFAICTSAVTGMSRAMAMDLRERNVRVNTVAIDHKRFNEHFDPDQEIDENIRSAVVNSFPLVRQTDIESEVGPVVWFLCSNESTALTGRTIIADGGYGGFR